MIRKYADAFNRHDLNEVSLLFSEDYVGYSTRHPEGLRGREANRKDLETFLSAFPDLQMKVSNVVAQGDRGWFEMELSGTHKEPLQLPLGTIPATNRSAKIHGAVFVRLNRGLAVEGRTYSDSAELMRQLGLAQQK